MAQTTYCEEAEWNAMMQDIQNSQQEMAKDIARARDVLEQMTDV